MNFKFHLRSYESNIPKFIWSRFLQNAMFFLPVWVIYIQNKHGIDLLEVTLLDSAFWITMALTEIPTGAVADLVGRKQSYILGIALSIVGNLVFALSSSYPLLLLGNSLWALALTFISGADLALFYDTLRVLGRVQEYPRFRSLIMIMDIVAIGTSGLLGAVIFSWNAVLPFYLYSSLLVLALLIALFLREPPVEKEWGAGAASSYLQILKTAAQAVRTQPNLRYILLYSNFLPLVEIAITVTFIQPHVIHIGLPVAALGVVMLGINLAQIAGSAAASRLSNGFGNWRLFWIAPITMAVGVIGLGLFSNLVGLFIFGLTAFTVMAARPAIESLLLSQTPGSVRATILSIDSLISRFLLAVIGPFAGYVADNYSLSIAFVLMGGITAGVLVLNLIAWRSTRWQIEALRG